ncbi:hypothetical protein TL18_02480 [Methanobrevibacter sp. YE315]|uniref:hypothetical protein n=1 Tax=Methanobrevibacter sp. YE315 TaxID=1609968 RepID=UPI000764D200|nr:hypothetical protein [Methanobrevibacter sp. YE315]AMD16987.1 hypothetical protein TL18_02480 [Methanobrevibacter sp. YE315]
MANKYLAAILSFIIPGLGQAYAGDIKKGIMYFAITLIVILIVDFIFVDWYYFIVDFLISIYAAYDAYLMVE